MALADKKISSLLEEKIGDYYLEIIVEMLGALVRFSETMREGHHRASLEREDYAPYGPEEENRERMIPLIYEYDALEKRWVDNGPLQEVPAVESSLKRAS
jgi:hypothetical protein